MAPVVKICGLRTVEAASTAIAAGSDLLGVIMVPNRKRTVSLDVAAEIAKEAQSRRKALHRKYQSASELLSHLQDQAFATHNEYFTASAELIRENGPFVVGVFRNQAIDDVFELAQNCGLDFIQLHGSEDTQSYLERNKNHHFGIIKRYVIPEHTEHMAGFFPKVPTSECLGFVLPLLDSEAGGEGKTIDWSLINDLGGKFLLAGGLSPQNLERTRPFLENVVGFDVSGGVEDEAGDKDLAKIEAFVVNAKQV